MLNLMQTLILLLQAVSHLQVATAVVYIVGGPAGWDFAPTASYYSDWAAENTFVSGDQLSFRYDPTEHDVQRVNTSDYATCNTVNPMVQYQSGNDLITLDTPGTYCFICGFAGHCEGGGMLIKLVVTGSTGSTGSPPPPPVPPKASPPPNRPPPRAPSRPVAQSPPPPPKVTVPPPPPPPVPVTSPNAGGQIYSPPPPSQPKSPPLSPPLSPTLSPTLSPPLSPPLLSPRLSPPFSHPKAPRAPPTGSSHRRNQTYESPGAPPPITAASPPITTAAPVMPPGPSNDTPAPSPTDLDDPDAASGRHFGVALVFASLVVAGAAVFW